MLHSQVFHFTHSAIKLWMKILIIGLGCSWCNTIFVAAQWQKKDFWKMSVCHSLSIFVWGGLWIALITKHVFQQYKWWETFPAAKITQNHIGSPEHWNVSQTNYTQGMISLHTLLNNNTHSEVRSPGLSVKCSTNTFFCQSEHLKEYCTNNLVESV